ncbi:4442_t:CDS:2, partial [Scutellospora calospora]
RTVTLYAGKGIPIGFNQIVDRGFDKTHLISEFLESISITTLTTGVNCLKVPKLWNHMGENLQFRDDLT